MLASLDLILWTLAVGVTWPDRQSLEAEHVYFPAVYPHGVIHPALGTAVCHSATSATRFAYEVPGFVRREGT
jgi:hypothetical protein